MGIMAGGSEPTDGIRYFYFTLHRAE
nr:hypothetical protein [Streptomyces roseifaciens]